MTRWRSEGRGDVYEYLLSKIAQPGLNGQFRTPRHIIKMMVALMQPKLDFTICDLVCGTAGFLETSEEYLMANHKIGDPEKLQQTGIAEKSLMQNTLDKEEKR